MNPEILQIMRVQGDIKIGLIRDGLSQDQAQAAACAAIHTVLTSEIANKEHAAAYAQLAADTGQKL